jgi:galactose mutarotase-like enzyme
MFRHGFARDSRFDWTERTATTARLVLTDNAATRAAYPFAFRFEIAYAMTADGLAITFTVQNTGDVPLPASMGAHPAFNWPLAPGVAKEAHHLTFSAAEPAPIRRVRPDGLLRAEHLPSPIAGHVLALHDGLFVEDAVILDRVASRSLRYGAPGTETVEVSWDGFPELGIWTRPGVDLLCIEPWAGMSDPVGFEGEIGEKPGMMILPPGTSRSAMHRIRVWQ